MTDNDIIKALECCNYPMQVCNECPIPNDIRDNCKCMETLCETALNLIKRQQAEIERLAKGCGIITEEDENWYPPPLKTLEEIKAEAIKEFAERLRKHYDAYEDYDDIYAHHIRDDIDFTLDDMLKGR